MKRCKLLLFTITLALTTIPSTQSFAEEEPNKILKEILFELKETRKELKNYLVIQNKSQLLLQQIEYQRQLLNQNENNEDLTKKEIEAIESSLSEVRQRLDEIQSEKSSKVISSNPDDGSNAEYNNLITISEQQQKQLVVLKNRLAEYINNKAEINKTTNELLVKYKNTLQGPN